MIIPWLIPVLAIAVIGALVLLLRRHRNRTYDHEHGRDARVSGSRPVPARASFRRPPGVAGDPDADSR